MIEPLRPAIEPDHTTPAPFDSPTTTPAHQNGQRINFPRRPPIAPPQPNRIALVPDPPTIAGEISPSAEWKKTPESKAVIDTIPVPICWVLLGASAAILLIEIWNYIS